MIKEFILADLTAKANNGDPEAQFYLGFLYHIGQFATQNFEEAIKWFRLAADQVNSKAMFSLGLMCRQGQGMPQNLKEAKSWFQKAADLGEIRARQILKVKSLRVGEGGETSRDKGETDNQKLSSAEKGDPETLDDSDDYNEDDESLIKLDFEASISRKAAAVGYPEAQFIYGLKCFSVDGAPQSYKEAMKWYLKAADQGNPEAMFNLGHMC